MFFFIPLSTDAPVYHWPFATVGLIVVNVLAFLATGIPEISPIPIEPFVLFHGQGIYPHQWFTSMFLHANFSHLLGNMLFLWIFGLVVEGKIGWWQFLVVYLGIGAGQSAIEQVISIVMANEGASLGASSAIYGLMAISLVWAPLNVVEFYGFAWLLVFFRQGIFEISIRTVAVVYFALDLLEVILTQAGGDFQFSTGVLHLMGALGGVLVGLSMLQLDLVDCEGWDIINLWQGKHQGRISRDETDTRSPREPARPKMSSADRHELAESRLTHLLDQGQLDQAVDLVTTTASQLPSWRPAHHNLLRLVRELQRHKKWSASVPIMVRCLQLYGEQDVRIRLTLAQILIQVEGRPKQALRVLAKLPRTRLPDPLERNRRQLIVRAKQMAQAGQLELETQDW